MSKQLDCHLAAISWRVAFHNLCRTHEALRMTPAMALGITHRVWSIGDLVEAALAAVPTTPTSTRAPRRCHRGRRGRFRERITFKDGVVQQSKFYDYRVPRLRDVPEMHVKLHTPLTQDRVLAALPA